MMQLTPAYGDQPIIEFGDFVGDPGEPVIRQRARLGDLLAGLDDDQWAAPTRCEGWSVQDVISHLVVTNQFWSMSIGAGLAGEPSRILASFDPVATPALLVESVRSWTPAETLEKFVRSNDVLATTIGGLEGDDWSVLAEAPPGHLPIRALALHALWDSLIHERDIALPLGLPVVEEDDETMLALAYVSSLGPAFTASTGSTRTGCLEVRTTDPDGRLLVHLGPTVRVDDAPSPEGTVTIEGPAVGLLESLSFRAPLEISIADDDRWLLGNLAEVFDQA